MCLGMLYKKRKAANRLINSFLSGAYETRTHHLDTASVAL